MPKRLRNKPEYTQVRKKLRNSMIKSEVVLWNRLRGKQLGWKFRRQHGIGPFIVDFFCPELKLAIEIDGISHGFLGAVQYDYMRQTFLESQGIIVLHFITEEI